MGLDVYVGPLSRYYSFDWETTIQQAGRTQGLDVTVVRPPGWEQPDPQERPAAPLRVNKSQRLS